jgi:TolB-like protein/DNA-binding SARP family transcriptional activator
MKIYKFRNCLLNTVERSVIRENECVDLTTKSFDVLQYLIENCDKVISKDELLGTVWNGSFVEESNLPVHISKLRRSLGETRLERFIETVQGVGYRFVAPVEEVNAGTWNSRINPDNAAGLELLQPSINSVAVLPLINESSDAQFTYIADGLTESITNSLSQLPGLKVIARNTAFRYKGKVVDAQTVGESLGVAWIITGRIRVVRDDCVVGTELVRVSDGTQLWGKQFNRPFSEIVDVKDEISNSVAGILRTNGRTGAILNNSYHSRDSQSYRSYLKGKYFFSKHTACEIQKAIDCFRQSILYDPVNVHAHVAVIDCYRLLFAVDEITYDEVLSETKPLLSMVAHLDQGVDELQLLYALLQLQLHWDLKGAERHVKIAIALNPNFVDAYHRYAEILVVGNRAVEATLQIERILELDPFSLLTYKRVGRWYYGLGDYDKALDFLTDACELEPNDYEALALMGATLTELGLYTRALSFFRKSIQSNPTAEVLSMIGYVHALTGKGKKAFEVINQLESETHPGTHPLKLARIYLALGEIERAFQLLNDALDRHEVDLYGVTYDPRLKVIRQDRRYVDLIARIGF